MADQSMALGTLFTANITDFLAKTRRVRSELNKFATGANQLNTRINGLNQTLNRQAAQSKKVVTATNEITKAQKTQNKQISSITGGWNQLGAAMRVTASYGVAAALIYSVTRALRTGAAEIMAYEQALKNLQAITGATNAEIEIMGTKVVEVADRTKYSATEVAEGMVLLGQSGFSAVESINAIAAVSDLAAGTLSDLKTTSDLLTSAIRAFNLNAIEATRVADTFANAINKSKLTIDKLRVSFNFVGATASQVGLSIEETAASMMVLANNGLRASTIGTGLRQVLSKLMAPTTKVRNAIEEAGFTVDQLNPKLVGFQTALANLQEILMDDSGMINMTKAFDMFMLRGAQAAAIVTKSFTDGSFQRALDQTYRVGSASEMMQKQAEGLAFAFKNLVDKAKNLAIALGSAGVAGVMEVFIDSLRWLVATLTDFTDSTLGRSIMQIAVWTGALYLATTAVKLLVTAIASFVASGLALYVSNLVGVFGVLAHSIGKAAAAFTILKTLVMGNIWGILLTVVAAAGVAIYNLSKRTERAIRAQEKLNAQTEQTAKSLDLYRKSIEKTGGRGREYQAILERLKKDHPELTAVVDENADSYEALAAALEKAAAAKFEESIVGQIETIKSLENELEKSKARWQRNAPSYPEYLLGIKEYKMTMEQYIDASEDGAEQFGRIRDKYVHIARQIYDSLGPDEKDKATDKAKEFVAFLDPEDAESILQKISRHFETFELRRIEKIKKVQVETQAMIEELGGAFKELSLMEQAKYGETMANMEKEIEEYRKRATVLQQTTEEQYAAEKAIKAKYLAEYIGSLHEEEESAVENAQRMVGILEDRLIKEQNVLDTKLEQRKIQYEQEIQAARNKGESVLEIEQQYIKDVASIGEKKVLVQEEINNQIIEKEKKKAEEILKIEEETIGNKLKAVNKWYEIQYGLEKKALDRRLAAVERSYAQEVREAELAAMEKNKAAEKEIKDRAEYIYDAWGKYVDIERDGQNRLVAFRQKGSDEIVRMVRDENGKVIAAHVDKWGTLLHRASLFSRQLVQAETGGEADDLYQQMFNRKLEKIDVFYDDQIQKAERTRELELELLGSSYSTQVDVAEQVNEKIAQINETYQERRIEIRKEELGILEGLLEDEVERYEQAQERILELRQELVESEQSRAEALDKIERKHMSDYQKYKADEAKFAELMAEAKKEAELAAGAETIEEQERRLARAKELYKEAATTADSLNRTVKEGGRTLVGSVEAQEDALIKVNEAYDGQDEIIERQIQLAERQAESAAENQNTIQEKIIETRKELEGLLEKEWVAEARVNIKGEADLDELMAKLKKLDGTVTESTHIHTTIEKGKKESRWGGFVDKLKMAIGGKLPGFGGGDIVDASLEPGEFVVRKEAVRNIGTDLLYAINNMRIGASDFLASVKARTGGLIPQIQKAPAFPRLAYQTGGAVSAGNIPNLGSLDLSIDGQETGKIYAEPNVLEMLSKQIKRKQRMRGQK